MGCGWVDIVPSQQLECSLCAACTILWIFIHAYLPWWNARDATSFMQVVFPKVPRRALPRTSLL